MGYARYEVYRLGEKIEAGYDVPDRCNRRWCRSKIDRGLAYLCGRTPGGDEYGCGRYFCADHLASVGAEDVPHLCPDCAARYVRQRLDDVAEVIAEALTRDGITVHGVEDGRPRVLVEMSDGFEVELSVER